MESAEKAAYYLDLGQGGGHRAKGFEKIKDSPQVRFISPLLKLVVPKGGPSFLEFIMGKASCPDFKVKVVSGLSLLASLEFAC